MNLISRVSLMALGPLAGAACRAAGAAAVSDGASAVAQMLSERFTDRSRRAADALGRAAERAWHALELALADDTLLAVADRADDRAFRAEVRSFLQNAKFDRVLCLKELRAARTSGALGGGADPTALAEPFGDLAPFSDPATLIASQWSIAEEIAIDLRKGGFGTLAAFLVLKPHGEPNAEPLLAVAVRYYFRRAVEEDPRLFQGLAFSQLEQIGRSQDDTTSALAGVAASLAALHATLRDQELPLAEEFVEVPVPTVADRFRDQTNGVLAVSPDESRVLGGSKFDGKLRLFDAKTGKELRRLPGHAGWVTCVTFSPDGKRALSGGEDAVKLWDVPNGKLLRTWPMKSAKPSAVAFAADGRAQVRCTDGTCTSFK